MRAESAIMPPGARRLRKPASAEVLDDELRDAYIKIAKLVERDGDAYLPLFERLHQEMEARSRKSDMKALARSVALQTN